MRSPVFPYPYQHLLLSFFYSDFSEYKVVSHLWAWFPLPWWPVTLNIFLHHLCIFFGEISVQIHYSFLIGPLFFKININNFLYGASLVTQWQRIHLLMQEVWVQFLGQEDPLEQEVATHPSIVAWEFPWREEPGGPWSVRSQKSWTWLSD